MEDVEFHRKLHRFGRVRSLTSRLKTSVRRYEQFGPARVTFFYGVIALLYAVGVPLRLLAAIYSQTCQTSTRSRITR